MKLVDLDSSHAARKKLPEDLNYSGDTKDSAKMNVWLHRQRRSSLPRMAARSPSN
jgi:Domain of unknown function (DUF3597)